MAEFGATVELSAEPAQAGSGWALDVARTVLRDAYGLDPVETVELGGEIDRNIAGTCAGGCRVVVKVGAPSADIGALQWQHDLLRGLHERSATEPGSLPALPEPLRARDGSDVTLVAVAGAVHPVRVHTWLPGRTVAEVRRHSPSLLRDWGRAAAQLVRALPADAPAGLSVTHHWDALRAPQAIASVVSAVTDADRVADVERILGWFDADVVPAADALPRQIVHQDLNDFNVLAAPDAHARHRLTGVLDFGDALHTARVSELAIAVAYAMLRKPDPLLAAADVVRGYCESGALSDAELRVVFPLAAARLCVNATTWTARAPHNGDYARARMRDTWPTIRQLAELAPSYAEAYLRAAAGRPRPPVGGRPAAPARPATVPLPDVVAAAFTPVETPVRRRTDVGAPATLRLGAELRTAGLRLPVAGTVVRAEAGTLVLRHDTEPPMWSRWSPVGAPAGVGEPVPAGPLPTAAQTVRVTVCTAADAVLAAPETIAWTAAPAWRRVCPDPGVLWGATMAAADPAADPDAVTDMPAAVARRARHFARSQRHYYAEPPTLVASSDVWLYDDRGLAYLDVMNNVAHVGHANPAVVTAAHEQSQRLNTNSRLVYPGIADYAERLAALLPDPLEVVFLVCTGSEANDLALRIARQVTGRTDVLVIDGAYHGNTAADTAVSPNRYRGPGGQGVPSGTHEVARPDRYRGPVGYGDAAAGAHYAADVERVVAGCRAAGTPPAAFLAESLMGTAGAIVHPPGYLARAFAAVRAAGGLCIADEVQVGFGRLGTSFWGFRTQDVVPDIVTMGKPIGNGYPLAAVVTTRAIADAFDTGMKYFNTFGGNPVACAVGSAVLDELERRDLPARAGDVGAYLHDRLRALGDRHAIIGDVRGLGLYLGVDLVRDRASKEPAADEARYVSERLKDEGVLTYPTGVFDNVLKIKPPLTFGRDHADLLVDTLDGVLGSEW